MSFRILPHTPKASSIKLDKKRQYWILEQVGAWGSRVVCYGLSEEDAVALVNLLDDGIKYRGLCK